MTPAGELLTVVIPTRNRRALVRRAIRSVQDSAPGLSIIVVDDGSTDGTNLELERLDVEVVPLAESRGAAGARNAGVERVRTPYVLFLDSDDTQTARAVEAVAAAIERHRPEIVLGRPAQGHEGDGFVPSARVHACYLETHRARIFRGAGCLAVRVESFRGVGGFDAKMAVHEDADLLLRLGLAGPVVVLDEPPLIRSGLATNSLSLRVDLVSEAADELRRRADEAHYPGADGDRRGQLGRLLDGIDRHASRRCLQEGMLRQAWHHYRRSAAGSLVAGRLGYVLGWPVLAGLCAMGVRGAAGRP